ncbi:hypothetical protein G7046_g2729 [Stylonectria norvegica]|nr:hypothetical protein G7046_g2729 [Stylonectria norvegica]
MALISAKTIITSVSLLHLTLAYFFLTSPSTVDNQSMVYILGESMGMPYASGFDVQSAPLAFLSGVLVLVALSDLVSLSMPDEVCLIFHWGTQAPLRFTVSLFFLLYIFIFGPSSPVYSEARSGPLSHPSPHNPSYRPSGWGGDGLKNRVFFHIHVCGDDGMVLDLGDAAGGA